MPALRESLMRFGTDQGVETEFSGSITRPIPDDLETLASLYAIGVVGEAGLKVRDFYNPAHQQIFDAIRSIYSSSGPVDVVTVADELRRHGVLEELGGIERLNELQNATPSVSGAEHYARIVMDTALLRRLIHTAGEITDIAFSEPDDVVKAVDMAESKMFEVAEDRVVDSTRPIQELLNETMDQLEENYERGDTITGAATGYDDLDELLSGLQKSTLNIVGARPAVGKTAFGLAHLLHARGNVRVIGLTSPSNVAFVRSLGCYDEVVTYDRVTSLPTTTPVAYVDMAGNSGLRESLHRHFGGQMKYSGRVGLTHRSADPNEPELPGAKPSWFFAPDQIRKRAKEWGPGGVDQRFGAAWAGFAPKLDLWLKVTESRGPAAVKQVYLNTLNGHVPPDEGHILSLAE